MTLDYSRELQAALRGVAQAALLCRSVQKKISAESLEKKDRSPVTMADFGAQAIISHVLEQAFPDDPIIGEEDAADLRQPEQAEFLQGIQTELAAIGISADSEQICRWVDRCSQSDYTQRFWTLDPIDGTKGFLRKEQYAISLALVVDGVVTLAVVGCPNLGNQVENDSSDESTGLLFSAIKGQGADVRGIWSLGEPEAVWCSAEQDSARMRFCESVESGHSSHGHSAQVAELLGITADPVRLDSQAKYAVVARGEADIYLRLPTRADYREKIWDHAGGVLVVEEAGGKVTDVQGQPLEFTHGRELARNRGVVVTNGHIHDRVIAALKQVGVE